MEYRNSNFSALFGIPGVILISVVLLSHLAHLRSCEYQYLFPLGTLSRYKFKDIIIRGRLEEISKDIVGKDGKNEPKEVIASLLSVIIMSIMFIGCYNYKDINKVTFVTSLIFDENEVEI